MHEYMMFRHRSIDSSRSSYRDSIPMTSRVIYLTLTLALASFLALSCHILCPALPPFTAADKILMLFGKVTKNRFTLDFRAPMTVCKSLAVALSTFADKLAVT